MRQFFIIIASILVSAFLLYFVLRDINIQQLINNFQQTNLAWIALCFVFTILSVATRGIRWRGLLNQRISTPVAIHLLGVTFLLNQLPLRAGEIARSLIVTRYEIPILVSAASILIERLFDVFLVVIVIIGVVLQLPDVPASVTQGAAIFGFLAIIGFLVLLFFAHFPNIPRSILAWLIDHLPFLERLHLAQILENLLEGLHPLVNWRLFMQAVLWTGIAWASSFMALYAAIRAVGISENALLLALLGGSLASLSIAIPVTLASIGLIEGAVALAGQMLNIDAIAYTAVGLSYHGIFLLVYIVMGLLGLFVLGISPQDILGQKAKVQD